MHQPNVVTTQDFYISSGQEPWGTAIDSKGKVWQTGNPEPTNWMVTATDSSFQSGYCGLLMLDQNGAVAKITSFSATSQ